MHARLRSAFCLLTVCAGLYVAGGAPVWPEEAEGVHPRVKELRQKRLVVLESIRESCQVLFQHGKLSFDEVHNASVDLFSARLEYAESRGERIRICDEAIKEAITAQEIAQARFERAETSRVSVLKAEAYVLKTQIDRQNAEVSR